MKNFIASLIFCIIFIFLLININNILLPKFSNRYYMMENDINYNNNYDIQVYGSCHAYTSFNPTYLKENYKLDSYVYANPGEIIPTTYLRMKNIFKKHAPKIAFVETWGIQAYDTYDSSERIFGDYLENNIELLPFSKEKMEVINDFNLDILEMNFHIPKYKDRIINFEMKEIDFNYSFEKTSEYLNEYFFAEMSSRIENNGFKVNPHKDVRDFFKDYENIRKDESLELEPLIVKYLNKIIELCKAYNVELIFYRAPYLSGENELKKINYFANFAKENNIAFIDLEKIIKYNYKSDFADEHHLSENGANKSTKYLTEYYVNKKTDK